MRWALLAFAAVATVVVADAVTGPLYHYKILDNLENEQDDEATYLIMFGHGEATHTNDETFLNLYYPFRDENRAPENLIQRLQWNDPELTEDGEETAQHLRNEFLQLVWPHVKRSQPNVVFMASSMAHALETALITVSTPMLREINAKWTVSDDLRDRNSGLGTAWRRSLTEQSYYCPKEFVALALEAGRRTVHKTYWETTNSMTSTYQYEAVYFSGLPERDPLRIEPLFNPRNWFFEPGTLEYVDDFQLNFETEKDAMGRVASVLIPALQERPAFAVVAAHPDTIEYALRLGKNVDRTSTPENIDTAKLLILKITGVSDAYRQRNHYY